MNPFSTLFPNPLTRILTSLAAGLLICLPPASRAEEPAEQASPATETAATEAAQREEDSAPAAANLPKQALTPRLLYQFLLAEIAGARNNVTLAVGAYLDLARTTRDPRVAKRAAEISLYARQPDAAIEAARIWVEADGEAPQARQMLAGLLLNAQRPEEAAVHLAKLLTLDGANPANVPRAVALGDGLMRIGRMLARHPDKAVALQLIEQLTQPHETIPEAHFVRAQAAVNAGQEARALAELERAQALRPEWEQAVLFKAQLQQRTSGKQAVETLGRFLADYPKAREVRIAYARTLVGDKRYEEARREFAALLEGHRDDPEVLYAVALLSLQLNDLVPAEEHFKHLLKLGQSDPNPLRYYLGQVAELGKRTQDALQWYGAVTPGEQFLPTRVRIATLLAQQGRLDEARGSLQQAMGAQPALSQADRVTLLIAEAQLLSGAGRVNDAIDLLDGKLAAQPDQPELLYESALLAEKLGRNDMLERNLRKLIRLKPDHAHAYNALGYSFADRGVNLDEAQSLIEKALELAPNDPFILDSKGWLMYRRGDRNAAFDILNKALALRPDPEIAAHLGEVLWIMGRRDEALKTWKDAARDNPANEALTATIKKFAP